MEAQVYLWAARVDTTCLDGLVLERGCIYDVCEAVETRALTLFFLFLEHTQLRNEEIISRAANCSAKSSGLRVQAVTRCG
jgi:hypothetical protein